jgi:hypothetical protein
MKKIAFVLLLATAFTTINQVAKAQESYEKGDIDLNLGVGISSGFNFIPVYFGGNYMIMDWLSAGAEVSFRMDRERYGFYISDYVYKRNGFGFVTRADYHFNELFSLPEKYDVYGGIDLGMAFFGDYKYDIYTIDAANSYFLGGPHAGARMFFGKFGINAQIGARSGDGAIIQFGATMKL